MFGDFLKIAKLLSIEGLISGSSGNVSIKFEDKIYITKSGSFLGLLTENDIVEITDQSASRESVVHNKIYDNNKDFKAIVHSHQVKLISFIDYFFLKKFGTFKGINKIFKIFINNIDAETKVVFPNFLTYVVTEKAVGSDILADLVSKAIIFNNACIVATHGVFAAGENLFEAYSYNATLFKLGNYLTNLKDIIKIDFEEI